MQKTSWFQKGLCNKPHKSQLKSILNIENVYAINTLRIHRSRLKKLATCAHSELLSISSDTYQVIEIQKKTFTKIDTQFKNQIDLTIWTICAF